MPFILLYTNQVVSDDIKHVPLVKWPKTPPSHGGNGGSTPPRDTNYLNSVSIRYWVFFIAFIVVLLTFSAASGQHLQDFIRFCNFYYCEIADAGGWYTDKRSSEQNGYASRLFWSSRNVKNMSERNARKRIKWLNFHRKFIPCRELFLTKTASK